MSMNETVSAERTQIAFFGCRNAGKSSLVNALTGQDLAVVSDVAGTTTDPVKKSMEILPLGPVVIIDTPGIDDTGMLGEMRVRKTEEVLRRCDIAVLVVDRQAGMRVPDRELVERFEAAKVPYIIAMNKADTFAEGLESETAEVPGERKTAPIILRVSALTGEGIFELKETLGRLAPNRKEPILTSDLAGEGDLVILVTPIDGSAPKGRLILPQQMVIRDLLDHKAVPVVTQVETYAGTLASLCKKPRIVITDSQAFKAVNEQTPQDLELTSFSILMARYKGILETAVRGAGIIDTLKDGDKVLICEGCTHHRQCGDIGTVKLPRLLQKKSGAKLSFSFTSSGTFPEDVSGYALIVHCGGCMLNEKEVTARFGLAKAAGTPITNYGTAIAHCNGILKRSIKAVMDLSFLSLHETKE